MVELKTVISQSKRDMRDVYCDTMIELGLGNENVMVLDIDCMHSMATERFKAACPKQYINMGIQEANGVGVAAGLSNEGMIPFFNAFGVFATRRAYDQIFISCGYAQKNVKIIGWDAGISATTNGGTHMPFEDTGIMRNIPGMAVVEPADTVAMASLLREAAVHKGNVYMRTLRRQTIDLYKPESEFVLGGSAFLRNGDDVSILASGMMVAEALAAAEILEEKGIFVQVVDMYSLKPLDENTVINCARKTGAIVTVENSNHIGGLSSAVAECLVANHPVPMERVAIEDMYGEVGNIQYLKNRYGLTKENIIEKVYTVLKRKSKKGHNL